MYVDQSIGSIKFQGPMYQYYLLANNFQKMLNIHKNNKNGRSEMEKILFCHYNF
jgi:hypothetical protein